MPIVNSLTPTNFDILKNYVNSKKVVMLGESIHLTSEFSTVRKSIIENLYDNEGFELLLFEGSPIEFWIAEEDFIKSHTKSETVQNFQKTALFGLWQTEEIKSVINQTLATQSTEKPMYISSYDVQIGQGRRFVQGLSVFEEFIKLMNLRGLKFKPSEKKQILFLDNLVSCKRKNFPSSSSDFEKANAHIDQLNTLIKKVKSPSLLKIHDDFLKMLPQFLKYSLNFCREATSSKRNYTEIRDEWASKQFMAQMNSIQKKTIIWAHSGHVRLGQNKNGRLSFGSYAKKQFGDEIFSLLLTANTGSATAFMDASGNEIELTEKPLLSTKDLSLERKLSQLSRSDVFIPVKGNESFFTSKETTRSEPDGLGLIDALIDFDGYYLVQKINPPKLNL